MTQGRPVGPNWAQDSWPTGDTASRCLFGCPGLLMNLPMLAAWLMGLPITDVCGVIYPTGNKFNQHEI